MVVAAKPPSLVARISLEFFNESGFVASVCILQSRGMTKRKSIEFLESKLPIREKVTKFGGQPVWLTKPQWPVSKTTGNLMRFVCQLSVTSELLGDSPSEMAYLFITDEDEYVDGTWKAAGGENAVILQPGEVNITIKKIQEGPTLYRMVKKMFRKNLVPEPYEFQVNLQAAEDPDFVDEKERNKWSENKWAEYVESLAGNKIGGIPLFLQNTEFPGPGNWRLLLQLDSTQVPFYVNFGDNGIGYVFLSEDGLTAKFLWQCS